MRSFVRAFIVILAASSVSRAAHADELTAPSLVVAPPVAERTNRGRNTELMVAGLAIFGASYSMNAMWAGISGDWRPAVPIAGPLVVAAQSYDGKSVLSRGFTSLLVMDSAVQVGGLVMAIVGAVTHKQVVARGVSIAPMASGSGAGLVIGGRF